MGDALRARARGVSPCMGPDNADGRLQGRGVKPAEATASRVLLTGRVGAGGVCGGTASPRRPAGHAGWAWALPKDQRWGESRRALGADSGTRAPSLGRHQGLSLEAWGLSLHMPRPWVRVRRCVCSCGHASASLGRPQAHATLSGSQGDKDTPELLCPSRRPPRGPGTCVRPVPQGREA